MEGERVHSEHKWMHMDKNGDTSLISFFYQTEVNENVERVRRAHMNDLENILPFFCLGILYIFTNPALSTAVLVFRFHFHPKSGGVV